MTGVPLFRFKQGDHICVFYEDETALLDILVPYFLDGIAKGERCFCAQTPAMIKRIREGVKRQAREAGIQIDPRALEFHTTDEVYFSTSTFAPVALMGLLKDSIAEAVRLGFTGIRMAGEMSFAAHGLCECDQLLEYERLVELAFPDRPALGICQYRVNLFSPEVLESVVAHHRQTLTSPMGAANHSSLAIRRGRYLLDIVVDPANPRSQFYYVAQEHGKRDILGWGVEHDFDEAITQGQSLLDSLQPAAD